MSNVEKLSNDLSKQRRKLWKNYRKNMTNAKFDGILNLKGSCAELEFDHDNEALHLIVQKHNTDTSEPTEGCKATKVSCNVGNLVHFMF